MSATVRAVVPGGTDDLPDVGGVATENPEYFCLLTRAGAALEAAAHAAGRPVRLTVISVGDGDGEVPVPADAAVDLVREVYRQTRTSAGPISSSRPRKAASGYASSASGPNRWKTAASPCSTPTATMLRSTN